MRKEPQANLEVFPTAYIKSLSHDGRGIASIQNKTIFISGALPDEIVHYKIIKKHKQFDEGQLVHVVHASKDRFIPRCEHFGTCGGCALQHMTTDQQLKLKQETLLEQLKHFGQVVPNAVLPPLSGEAFNYRHKARLSVKFVIKKNKVLVGFREKSSRYIAELNHCPVLHPSVGEKLNALSELVASLECYQSIPQIEVAVGDTSRALVIRHLQALPQKDEDLLRKFGEEQQFDLYLQPKAHPPLIKLWPKDLSHRLRYQSPDHQIEFLFHPLDFTQVNLEINKKMVNQALDCLALQSQDTVLDLFCGIGNLTLPIARYAKEVIGVEGNQDMIDRAYENAKHNQINNAKFLAADLSQCENHPWRQSHYDKIVLDPPRSGSKEILPFIAQLKAKKIVYISCNPATLARDAGILTNQYAYRLHKIGIINMFPHTAHIETMAVFEQ